MNIKKLIICAAGLISALAAQAQDFEELWITGSAVPGGAQKMERTPNGQFRYAGPLDEGTVRVQDRQTTDAATLWLMPEAEDAQFVSKGTAYRATGDRNAPGLSVTFAARYYRLYVAPESGTMRGVGRAVHRRRSDKGRMGETENAALHTERGGSLRVDMGGRAAARRQGGGA